MAEKVTSSSPPEDRESSSYHLQGILYYARQITLDVTCDILFEIIILTGGSRKRPDQPCSSSSLQSKRSRENSDTGGEYIPQCT